MRDELESRLWVEQHTSITSDLDREFAKLAWALRAAARALRRRLP